MLNTGKGIVEVMQQVLPALILRRATKPDGMGFKRLPVDEQHISVGRFYAALELVRKMAWNGRNDLRRAAERGLKFRFKTVFSHSRSRLPRSWSAPESPNVEGNRRAARLLASEKA